MIETASLTESVVVVVSSFFLIAGVLSRKQILGRIRSKLQVEETDERHYRWRIVPIWFVLMFPFGGAAFMVNGIVFIFSIVMGFHAQLFPFLPPLIAALLMVFGALGSFWAGFLFLNATPRELKVKVRK
jgi:hypothetical protein